MAQDKITLGGIFVEIILPVVIGLICFFLIINCAPPIFNGVIYIFQSMRVGGPARYEMMKQAAIEGVSIIESDLNMSCIGPHKDGMFGRSYFTCTNATTNRIVDVHPTWGKKKIPGRDRFENALAFDTLCYYTVTGGPGRVVQECM